MLILQICIWIALLLLFFICANPRTILPILKICSLMIVLVAIFMIINSLKYKHERIQEFVVTVKNEELKLDKLFEWYQKLTVKQAIIFCNSPQNVDWLTEKMHSRDFPVSAMHDNMDEKERDAIMKAFRTGSSRILITTDIFEHADTDEFLIINWNLPKNAKIYRNRIGYFDRHGFIIYLVTDQQHKNLNDIEQLHQTTLEELKMDIAELIEQ